MLNKGLITLFLLFFILNIQAQTFFNDEPLAHTYSIVAYDPVTGDMGVAVQSHWFSVGTVVTWGEAGVGVIATQSLVNVSFGVRGLELLKKGLSPEEVVDSLIKSDEGRDLRQLAVLDSKGRVATHTGLKCIKEAGHIVGDNFSVQANMMLNNTVWPAMAEAYQKSSGPLAERMLTALEAAEKEGGDIRGRQSVALVVFRGKPTGKVWEDKLVDLRVDDSPEPLVELARLLKVHRAYENMNNGDLAIEKGDHKSALDFYGAAMKMFPENEEMKYWTAVSLANIGKMNEALPMFKDVFTKNANYIRLTERILENSMLNVSMEDYYKILAQQPK